jgi:transcriptional regulator
MYVPPVHKVSPDVATRFVRERAFGMIVAVDGALPVAVHVPFLVEIKSDGEMRLEAHVARVNPFHQVIARAPDVLVTVSGPDAYISPDWYIAKDQVPTWNYIAVHLRGTVRLLPAEAAAGHSDRLSAAFEARLHPKPPWRAEKMSQDKHRAMLSAIVAFEVHVSGFDASWKLGQHKTRADRIEVARMLAWRGAWSECAIAEHMQAALRAGR